MIQRSTHNTLALLILCFLIATSCSNGDSSGIVFKDGFASIPIDIDAPRQNLADFIESVEIIQLEETPNSLLGDVMEYEKVGDKLVLRNVNTNSVTQYTHEGEFLSSFSKVGNGPKEYSFILSFWVEGESVFFYDSPNGRVQEYDIEGNFKSSTRIAHGAVGSIISRDGSFYLSTIRPIDGENKYYALILDQNGEVEDMQIPYAHTKLIYISWGYPDIRMAEDELIHHYVNNDTVYIQRDGQFEPYISFDFADNWAWKGVEEIKSSGDYAQVVRQRDKVSSVSPVISGRLIFSSYKLGGDMHSVLIDLKSGESITLKDAYSNAFRPLEFEDGKLVYSVDSDRISDLVGSLTSSQIEYRGGASLESIESSENPALVKIKFKESSEW